MTSRGGNPIDPPLDVFVHQVSLPQVYRRKLKELKGADNAALLLLGLLLFNSSEG